jgi:outer membrane receptor protein involved in Fe transport
MSLHYRLGLLAATSLPAFLAQYAMAQTVPALTPQASTLASPQGSPGASPTSKANSEEEITVVGTSPLLGIGVDRNSIPVDTQVLNSADISRNGNADVLNALNKGVAGVNLDSGSGNPYQPNLFYNGFEASPLQGTSQGLAVYVNGVRFNQPFGDTVNWDMIPDIAISSIAVEGSNPVFGLNALGGSFNVQLKDGFSYHGGEAVLSGGSFSTIQGDLQYGVQSGNQALYVAGSVVHQDGWRDLQSTDIQNMYADYGIRSEKAEVHFDLQAANSGINGPGSAPIELLAADSAAQFTAPNAIYNRSIAATLRGNIKLSDTLSVQGVAYYDYFQQRVFNGNSPNDFPCDDGTGLLCQDVGVPSTTRGGTPIPAFLGPNPFSYNELDTQTTNTNGYGASGQVTDTGEVFGFTNHVVAGASYDGAQTLFSATAFIGGVTPLSRVFIGPGEVIDEPGNTVPVRVSISDDNVGVFGSDTLNLTNALALTVSGRFNFAEVNLNDLGRGDLTGNHAYARFNPSAGLTYKFFPWLTAYGSYAEANRAPTPQELSCAGPQNSCSLANFFVGDPDLNQVVAHTFEAGLRGRFHMPDESSIGYDLSLFHTNSDDDIVFINSSSLNYAFFANVGQTRRQGLSFRVDYKRDWLTAYVDYAYVDATTQTQYVESSGSNPAADAAGNLTVKPGDQLAGVPRTTLKIGMDFDVTRTFHIGGDGQLQSGQYLAGDEANLTAKLPGFFVMNLRTSYDITPWFQLFASAQNVLDRRYYTFGTFAPTNSVFLAQAPTATNPRSYSLAAPLGWFGGVKLKF